MVDRVLLKYLRQMYELESELYTLTRTIYVIQRPYYRNKHQLRSELFEEREYHNIVCTKLKGKEKLFVILGVFFIIFNTVGLIYGIYDYREFSFESNLFSFTIMGVFLLLGIILFRAGKKARYHRVKETYISNERFYKSESERIRKHNEEIHKAYEELDKIISDLYSLRTQKEHALRHMYSYNIVHQNYRNFYGISKLYHLLDTGICSTLDGRDGAYARMESEEIIENADIESHKECIAKNHMMKKAVSNTNMQLFLFNQENYYENVSSKSLLEDIKSRHDLNEFIKQCKRDDEEALRVSKEYTEYAKQHREPLMNI